MEPTEIANARAAYNAYNAGGDPATANKNFRGEPCPEWDDLPQNIRDKWIAATAPASETLDNACLWRDDALAEWRKSYPCPRGCGTMGQCVDPATMSPAICPVCYNETPARPNVATASGSTQPPGLYKKFEVYRTDGRDQLGGDRAGARYIVLDLTYDKHSRAALLAYADAVAVDYPVLAVEMKALADALDFAACDSDAP